MFAWMSTHRLIPLSATSLVPWPQLLYQVFASRVHGVFLPVFLAVFLPLFRFSIPAETVKVFACCNLIPRGLTHKETIQASGASGLCFGFFLSHNGVSFIVPKERGRSIDARVFLNPVVN
jgi:hypothetical protein